jgi:hypothetical protein
MKRKGNLIQRRIIRGFGRKAFTHATHLPEKNKSLWGNKQYFIVL